MKRYVLSVLVRNSSGVLTRISGLFSRRGFNIDSLTSGKTENSEVSRLTIALVGDEDIVEQLIKQLNKLEDVIKIQMLNEDNSVYRELVLIKVNANDEKRSAIIEIANIFRSKIVDVSTDTVTIELTGDEDKVTALIKLMDNFGIKELVRTGVCALERGESTLVDYSTIYD